MTLHVFDTDVLSLYQLGNETVCQRIEQHDPGALAVTIITVEEQLSSWYTLRRQVKGREKLARVYDRFTDNVRCLTQLQILSFSEAEIDRYEELSRLKLRVKANDLRIASIALCHSAIVVTRNRRDFSRVPGLRIDTWGD